MSREGRPPRLVVARGAREVMTRYRTGRGVFVDVAMPYLPVAEVFDGLPVREFRVYKGRRHYSGWYWCATTGGHVVYESRLELARIFLADHDRDVVAIAAQPFVLAGFDGSRLRQHVPDLLLGHVDGTVTVVDVKAASRLSVPAVSEQFSWTRQVCDRYGFGFEVWSGADPTVVENVRFLAAYRRAMLISDELVPLVIAAAQTPCSVGELEIGLAESGADRGLARPVILHLLWTGRMQVDLRVPLGAHSVVHSAVPPVVRSETPA